jgi:hypothetical protein
LLSLYVRKWMSGNLQTLQMAWDCFLWLDNNVRLIASSLCLILETEENSDESGRFIQWVTAPFLSTWFQAKAEAWRMRRHRPGSGGRNIEFACFSPDQDTTICPRLFVLFYEVTDLTLYWYTD